MADKWKQNLLSSGLPLEFDVAKFLVFEGFYIHSNYTYSRITSAILKDFSIDIKAVATLPFDNPDLMDADLSLLIECKYRNPNVKWLFLPELNSKSDTIDLCAAMNVIDDFSLYYFPQEAGYKSNRTIKTGYKGTEISDNKVDDAELNHGIEQLRFALPRLLTDDILASFADEEDFPIPFLYCSILVTTAELLLVNRDVTIDQVRNSKVLSDLAVSTPFIMLESDYGPEFENHCSEEFNELWSLEDRKNPKIIDEKRMEFGKTRNKYIGSPITIYSSLANCERYRLSDYFTRFVICNYKELPKLIKFIKEICSKIMESKEKID